MTTAKRRPRADDDGWRDASGEILVSSIRRTKNSRSARRIRVLGMLQRPPPAMNPGQFDWAAYYREQRILASIQVPHADAAIEIISTRPAVAPGDGARSRSRGCSPPASRRAIARSRAAPRLVLGDSDPELRDVQEQFRRTGTSHHLAISGMHVAVLGGFVYGVCRLLLHARRA